MKKFLFILLLYFSGSIVFAQEQSMPGQVCHNDMESWVLTSRVIGEEYTIYVLLPPGYDNSKEHYPVWYMTDGDWNMSVAKNCFSMLRQDYDTREPIVVGIGYGEGASRRSRDLNPDEGGPKFVSFITEEVFPFIKETYRINDEAAIYGYSLGGRLATYILFNRPEAFDMIGIGAPGNYGRELIPEAEKYFASHKELNMKVFAGAGAYEPEVIKNLVLFQQYMENKKLTDFSLSIAITPQAGHGAALAEVMKNAALFGYCRRHTVFTGKSRSWSEYAGLYVFEKDSSLKAKVYIENKKLILEYANTLYLPTQLIPCSEKDFFVYENERMDFSFLNTPDKKELLITLPDKKQLRMVKKMTTTGR